MLEISPQLQAKVFDSVVLCLRSGPKPWGKLSVALRGLGLDKPVADAVLFWANTQAESSGQTPVKIRILHPMEKEFISVEAYDYFLDLLRLGLIGPMQMEQLIEGCAFMTVLPVNREQARSLASKSFWEGFAAQGLGTSQ